MEKRFSKLKRAVCGGRGGRKREGEREKYERDEKEKGRGVEKREDF